MAKIPMAETLDWHAKRDPDRLAVVCGHDVISRLELEKASNQAARVFASMGVGPGDLVTIALPNSVAFYVSAFGALGNGERVQRHLRHLLRRPFAGVQSEAGL